VRDSQLPSGAHCRAVTDPSKPADQLREYVTYDATPSGQTTSFVALMRDARVIAHRNADTGNPLPEEPRAGLWPGALLYLVLVEQVGSTLTRAGIPIIKEGSGHQFRTALTHFGDRTIANNQDAQFALWALRCSFAHAYVAAYKGSGNPKMNHLFELTWSSDARDNWIVSVPSLPWDGNVGNAGSPTPVNLYRVEELGEHVIHRVQAAARTNDLRLRPGVTIEDLNRRYHFTTTPAAPIPSAFGHRQEGRITTIPAWSTSVSGSPGPPKEWD
jgi:hypothetical protein